MFPFNLLQAGRRPRPLEGFIRRRHAPASRADNRDRGLIRSTHLVVAVDAITAAPGGGITYLREQLSALHTTGVEILTFCGARSTRALGPAPDLRIIQTPEWLEMPLLQTFFRLVVLPRYAKRLGAHVVYCPGSVGVLSAALPSVICVQNPHLFCPASPRSLRLSFLRTMLWLTSFRANLIVHISDAMKTDFKQYSQLDVPSRVIHSGVPYMRPLPDNAKHSETGNLSFDMPYLFIAANLYPYKRIDLAIAALAIVRSSSEMRLVIAGRDISGSERSRLERFARQRGVDHAVDFVGFRSGAELVDLYKNAFAALSCSEREAFPLTPAESISLGVRTILSDIAAHRELYSSGAQFFVPGSAASLAEQILQPVALASSDLSLPYTWTENAEALRDVLENAASEAVASLRASRDRWVNRRPLQLYREFVGTGVPFHSEARLLHEGHS